MDQIKYQGYARDRGFNPIQVSNANVDAIAQQGQGLLRQLRSNQAIERSNRDAYLSGQEFKQQAEQRNRDANFQFAARSRQAYQDGVSRNLQTKIQDATRAQQSFDKDMTTMGALASLAPTLSKVVTEYQKNKDEADEIEGMNLVAQYGVTPEKLQRYQAGVAKLDRADAAVKGITNQLEFEGVPVDVLERLRGLSGRKLFGATKMYAINGANNYPIWRAQNGDTPVPFGDGETTLNGAKSQEEWETANAYLRNQYLKQFIGINPVLLNESLFPKMGNQELVERGQYLETLYKVKQEDLQEEKKNDLRTEVSSETPGAGLMSWIQREAGVDANGKSPFLGQKGREAFKILKDLADKNLLDDDTWEAIKSHQYLHNDGSTRQVQETFALYVDEINDVFQQRKKEAYQEREFNKTLAGEELDKLFQEKYEAEGFSDAELEQAKAKYASATGGKASQFLSSIESRTAEKMTESIAEQHLRYLANRGMLTTKELMQPGKYPESIISRFRRDAADGDKLGSLDQAMIKGKQDILNARAQELLGQTGSDKKDSSAFKWAQLEIDRVFKAKVLEEFSKGNQSGAVDAAYEFVNNLLWDGKQKQTGPFAMTNDIGSLNPYVGMGKANSYAREVQRVGKLSQQLRNNPSAIENTVVLEPPEMKQLKAFSEGRGGSIPAVIFSIASKSPTLSPIDIINAQLKAAGGKLMAPVLSEQVRQGMSPYQQRIMQWKPSNANTYQAFGMNQGPDPYRGLLDLIASKESLGNGDYNAMNRGGDAPDRPYGSGDSSQLLGVPLSNMTVAQVMEAHSRGDVWAAGRYQIIPKTLRGLLKGSYGSTGVNINDRFDAATQDKLAIALIRGRAGKFFNGSGSISEAIVGMGNEWIGLRKVSPTDLSKRLENTRQMLNSPSIWRQPEGMRSGIVYRIGSLGYGSTGPHLDLKRVDRGTLKSTGSVPIATNELDNFVDVQANGKWKPLSKGTTVTDHENQHRARGSYGVDYAAKDGTPVRLKNGAKVVGTFKGDQGTDHTIIELPDGRRFQFLHGTNA